MMGMGLGLTGLLFMFLFMVGAVVLAIWLIGALFPRAAPPAASGNQDLNARQILDRRYAQGEMTREEYETMKQDVG